MSGMDRQQEKMSTGWMKVEDDTEINFLGFKTRDGREFRIRFDEKPFYLKTGEAVKATFSLTEAARPKFFKGNPFRGALGIRAYFWCGLIMPMMEVEILIWRKNGKQQSKFRYARLEEVG